MIYFCTGVPTLIWQEFMIYDDWVVILLCSVEINLGFFVLVDKGYGQVISLNI